MHFINANKNLTGPLAINIHARTTDTTQVKKQKKQSETETESEIERETQTMLLLQMQVLVPIFLLLLPLLFFVFLNSNSKSKSKVPKSFAIFANRKRLHPWLSDILQDSPSATIVLRRSYAAYQVFSGNPAVVQHIFKTNFPNYTKKATFPVELSPTFLATASSTSTLIPGSSKDKSLATNSTPNLSASSSKPLSTPSSLIASSPFSPQLPNRELSLISKTFFKGLLSIIYVRSLSGLTRHTCSPLFHKPSSL